jgi:hypothetical protein
LRRRRQRQEPHRVIIRQENEIFYKLFFFISLGARGLGPGAAGSAGVGVGGDVRAGAALLAEAAAMRWASSAAGGGEEGALRGSMGRLSWKCAQARCTRLSRACSPSHWRSRSARLSVCSTGLGSPSRRWPRS